MISRIRRTGVPVRKAAIAKWDPTEKPELAKVIGKLLTDRRFRAQFQKNPTKSLQKMGIRTATPSLTEKLSKISKIDLSQLGTGSKSITLTVSDSIGIA